MPKTPDTSAADRYLADRAPDWLAAVARRLSRRTFDGVKVGDASLESMAACCERFQPYAGCRTALVRAPQVDVFTGIVGSYGKVTGAPHVLVFIGDKSDPYADQHVGLTGEAAVLEAAALGLDTCWIGGFFNAEKVGRIVDLSPGERVYAVSPLGLARDSESRTEKTMRSMAGSKKRKCVEELAPGIGADWPPWAVAAVETARLAPSAVNRQPWRFRMEDGGLVVFKDGAMETPKVTKRLDCGIAMLHVQIGAQVSSSPGVWTDLSGSDVARYDTEVSA